MLQGEGVSISSCPIRNSSPSPSVCISAWMFARYPMKHRGWSGWNWCCTLSFWVTRNQYAGANPQAACLHCYVWNVESPSQKCRVSRARMVIIFNATSILLIITLSLFVWLLSLSIWNLCTAGAPHFRLIFFFLIEKFLANFQFLVTFVSDWQRSYDN